MNEVDIQALDVGLELRKLVEVVFSFREVVLVLPECDHFLEILSIEAVFKTNAFQRLSIPFTFGKSVFQTSNSLLKKTAKHNNTYKIYRINKLTSVKYRRGDECYLTFCGDYRI